MAELCSKFKNNVNLGRRKRRKDKNNGRKFKFKIKNYYNVLVLAIL